MKLFGIDGCKGAWVVARADRNLYGLTFTLEVDLSAIFQTAAKDGLAVIDIPIGLPESGHRACDQQAKEIVGERRNSVFVTPVRQTLSATTHLEASRLNAEYCEGKKISIQTFCILNKIREIDTLMNPLLQTVVREAHPEVTFASINRAPLSTTKKSLDGENQRLLILKQVGIALDPRDVLRTLHGSGVERNDITDAAACLATAHRIATNRARVLPEGKTCLDAKGLRMEIVA